MVKKRQSLDVGEASPSNRRQAKLLKALLLLVSVTVLVVSIVLGFGGGTTTDTAATLPSSTTGKAVKAPARLLEIARKVKVAPPQLPPQLFGLGKKRNALVEKGVKQKKGDREESGGKFKRLFGGGGGR